MDLWQLPTSLRLGQTDYAIGWDYRCVLQVLSLLADEQKPLWQRWFGAVGLFYKEPVPTPLLPDAMGALTEFVTMGQPGTPGMRLFDWQADAPEIISDINRVAGFEVRRENLHWWTFLGWFRAIGEGQLSFLVGLRAKLARGEKLSPAEQEYLRANPHRARLRRAADPEKKRLEALLN